MRALQEVSVVSDNRTLPLNHNSADLPTLSHEELELVEAARAALATLKRTYEFWIMIARILKVLKGKADRHGGRKTFDQLHKREGLGEQYINKTRVSRLLAIHKVLPAVERWRAILTDGQRLDWASPEAIVRKCPALNKVKPVDPNKLSPMAQLKQANIALQEENHRLKQRTDGDRFRPEDTTKDIAVALVGTLSGFSSTKAEKVAHRMIEIIRTKRVKASNSTPN
jgi:hypothetical protein